MGAFLCTLACHSFLLPIQQIELAILLKKAVTAGELDGRIDCARLESIPNLFGKDFKANGIWVCLLLPAFLLKKKGIMVILKAQTIKYP